MQTITINGISRPLGCLPRVAQPGEIYPVFGERPGGRLIPRAEWREVDHSHLVTKILDQDGQGACNAFASVQALMCLRTEAGLPYVELSAGNLYGRINGGRDAGSTLGDAIQTLEREGVCKASTIGHLQWRKSTWPAGWQEEARRFRVLEAWDCPSFDHLASALQLGFFVNLGILVGGNFETDSDGWVPDRRGGGGGHAMCGVGLFRHPRTGRWGIKVANSWGTDWGLAGFGIVPESYFGGAFTDGWAVRGLVDPTGEE